MINHYRVVFKHRNHILNALSTANNYSGNLTILLNLTMLKKQ